MSRLRVIRFLLAGALGGCIGAAIGSDEWPPFLIVGALILAADVLAWMVHEESIR